MIADLLQDADRMRVPDMPMLAHAAKKLTGFDPDEQYDIAVEAWVYGRKSFDPAKAKWSTYFYNTVGLIGRREWFKKSFRKSVGIKIVHGVDPEVDFIASLPAPADKHYDGVHERIMVEVRKLKPKFAAAVIAYYGLDGNPEMTQDAIGRKLGLSRERVRQMLDESRDLMRDHLRERL